MHLSFKTHAIFITFDKLTRVCFSPNCTRNHTNTLHLMSIREGNSLYKYIYIYINNYERKNKNIYIH